MHRNVQSLSRRRWNIPALAYRALARLAVIVGGLVVVIVAAPFVALFAATLGTVFALSSLRDSWRLRRYVAAAGPLRQSSDGSCSGTGTGGAKPARPQPSDRRRGALVGGPRPRRRLPVLAPDWKPDRAPDLQAIDFERSIDAMARHGWMRADVLRQLQGLGASWLWSAPVEPIRHPDRPPPKTPRGVPAGATNLYLEHRKGRRLMRWFEPPVEILLTFDAQGRLVDGTARRDHLRI